MALTAPRNTPQSGQHAVNDIYTLPVKQATAIWQGGIVCIDNTTGYAVPGSVATTLIAIGRADESIAAADAVASGTVSVRVRAGTFRWANSADADAITQAWVGKTCYIVDAQTVAKTDGSAARSVAGIVVAVDTLGVWVAMGPAVSGTVSVGTQYRNCVVPIPVDLTATADADVVARFTPGFAGTISKIQFVTEVIESDADKAGTLVAKIAGTSTTGGVVTLTTATCDTKGECTQGTAITAANAFTNAQEITVVAAVSAAFTHAKGILFLTLG